MTRVLPYSVQSQETPVRPLVGRVLVVDDEDALRNAVVDVLQDAGFDVAEANSGLLGLSILRADPRIRLVLLDLVMNGVDGWQFRDEQLRDAALARIPTIVLSGSPLEEIEHRRLQAADYLLKPVGSAHLVSVVETYCKRRNG